MVLLRNPGQTHTHKHPEEGHSPGGWDSPGAEVIIFQIGPSGMPGKEDKQFAGFPTVLGSRRHLNQDLIRIAQSRILVLYLNLKCRSVPQDRQVGGLLHILLPNLVILKIQKYSLCILLVSLIDSLRHWRQSVANGSTQKTLVNFCFVFLFLTQGFKLVLDLRFPCFSFPKAGITGMHLVKFILF